MVVYIVFILSHIRSYVMDQNRDVDIRCEPHKVFCGDSLYLASVVLLYERICLSQNAVVTSKSNRVPGHRLIEENEKR